MSEIAPVKCRIEIFCGTPYFFDDHFCKATWTPWQAAKTLDGDVVTVTIEGGQVEGAIQHPLGATINTNPHNYVVIRNTGLTGTVWYIEAKLGATVKVHKEFSVADLETVDLYAENGNVHFDYDALVLGLKGVATNIAKFDYVAICKSTLLTPVLSGEVVDEHTITRPMLSQGISGTKLTITNFNGENTGKIKPHDVIIIWLARASANLGDPAYKVFGGRIVNPTNRGSGYGAHFIDLDCHDHGWELIAATALLQKLYSQEGSKTIIDDCLALCSYLAPHPTKYFNCHTNCGFHTNSKHDAEYDETKLLTPIQEILEKAFNPISVRAFDAYITPSGCFVGHARNSADHNSPIVSITPETYSKSEDVHRVKNKIKIYGKKDRKEPSDGDAWTESLDNWTAITGTLALVSSTPVPKVGSYCVNCSVASGGLVNFYRSHDQLFVKKSGQIFLRFWIYEYFGGINSGKVRLRAPDNSNYFEADLGNFSSQSWFYKEFELGKEKEYDPILNPNGIWTKAGSPNWGNIKGVQFYVQSGYSQCGVSIDGLYYFPVRYSGMAEDSSSQSNYGVRAQEPEIDEVIASDIEALAKATALKDFLKDPVISLQNASVDGDHRYTPGDRQRVIVGNDNYDAYSRIVEVQHKVVGVTWDSILKTSNQPQLIEFHFLDMDRKIKLNQRAIL